MTRTKIKRTEAKPMIEEYLINHNGIYKTLHQIRDDIFINEVSDRFVWNALEELIKEGKVEKRLFIRSMSKYQNGGVINGYRWIR